MWSLAEKAVKVPDGQSRHWVFWLMPPVSSMVPHPVLYCPAWHGDAHGRQQSLKPAMAAVSSSARQPPLE